MVVMVVSEANEAGVDSFSLYLKEVLWMPYLTLKLLTVRPM